MRRALVLSLLLATGSALAQDASPRDLKPAERPYTPVWLPRSVWAGALVSPATTPTFRLAWVPVLWSDRTGILVFVAEGGLGYALGKPENAGLQGDATMSYFYQHTAQFGAGFRSGVGPGFHWGFQITTGPVWYGARFAGSSLPKENRVQGLVEGRLQGGYEIGGVEYGVSIGYSSPYKAQDRGNSTPFVGGGMLGLYADWR